MVVMRKTRMLYQWPFYVILEYFSPFSSFVRIAIAYFESDNAVAAAAASDLERTTCPVASCNTCHAFQGERTLLQPAFQSVLRFCKGKDHNCLFLSLCSVCFPLFHEALCLVASLFRLKLLSWGATQIPTDPAWIFFHGKGPPPYQSSCQVNAK